MTSSKYTTIEQAISDFKETTAVCPGRTHSLSNAAMLILASDFEEYKRQEQDISIEVFNNAVLELVENAYKTDSYACSETSNAPLVSILSLIPYAHMIYIQTSSKTRCNDYTLLYKGGPYAVPEELKSKIVSKIEANDFCNMYITIE